MALKPNPTFTTTLAAVWVGSVLELARLGTVALVAWYGPCAFPSNYQKRVHLFERSDEHGLICSTSYDAHTEWATVLLPLSLCMCASLPLELTQPHSTDRASQQTRLQKRTRLIAGLLFASFNLAVTFLTLGAMPPMFGTDAKPLAFDVDCSVAVYLAALVPVGCNLIDIGYSVIVHKQKP